MTETDKILPALAKAQASYPKVGKLKKGHYGNYADLVSIMESVRKPNRDAGLIVIHTLEISDAIGHYTQTHVIHVESGQSVTASLRLDPDLSEQSLGKAITYARRYCLMGLLGICADEDTDGREAEDEQRQRSSVRASTQKPSKADKEDAQNRGLGTWWASIQYVMTQGGTIIDPKKQKDTLREMVGAMGYESAKELSVAERNELLAEVQRLYGTKEHARPMGVDG